MSETSNQTKIEEMDEDQIQIIVGNILLKTHGISHDDVTDEFMEELDEAAWEIMKVCEKFYDPEVH